MTDHTPSHIDIDHFKKRLEEELNDVKSELSQVAVLDPDTDDWSPKTDPSDLDDNMTMEDDSEHAEDFRTNDAIMNDLEIRYQNIKRALKKIDNGTYGICEIGQEPIELDRLEVNPSARTCKQHLDEETTLPM